MAKAAKTRAGRPRSFDREDALEKAMQLFWAHGYEGASIMALTSAIGIAPPSLYAAFGSKAELYREALDRYGSETMGFDLTRLDRAGTLEQALTELLEHSAQAVADRGAGRGCMVSSGMIACAPEHESLASEMAGRRRAFQDQLGMKLRRWLDSRKAAALARWAACLVQGLSIQARDGATEAELQGIVRQSLLSLQGRPL